ELVRALVAEGMDCARINCAHDDEAAWTRMIANVRGAAAAAGRVCTVLMDLAGPKVRTSEVVTPGPGSRVHRDDRILLTRGTPAGAGPMPFQAACSIPAILDQLSVGAPVWIDDGKIGARVEALRPEGAVLVVTQTGPRGARLAPDKGLNF